MIIKKYKSTSEAAAIIMARDDLGKDAIVMNVKTIKPKGIFRIFKSKIVEVTAAIDDNTITKEIKNNSDKNNNNNFKSNNTEYTEISQNAIEEKINSIAKLLEMQMKPPIRDVKNTNEGDIISNKYSENELYINNKIYNKVANTDISNSTTKGDQIIELIHTQLLDNEVLDNYANEIIKELDSNVAEKSMDYVLASVYQKIVLKLGEIYHLNESDKKPKIVFFVGNTGVGKTTTMAKLVSKYLLDYKKRVAMISVDTYRIAAIEQIKTYASILNTPMEVAYTKEDIKNIIDKHLEYDYIFVDTAGRSHNNDKQTEDLKEILDTVKEFEKEVFLVVSATTKYSDLKRISKAYSSITDYKIIFTKLDETRGLGNILNIKMETNKALSYVTWGQNVPEDLGELNPQVIAKKLLGGND